jgi:prolycopene isomerase
LLDQLPRVVVIGSGIGGSALTTLLAHAGVPVTLLEKNAHLGGICAGYDKQGFHIDFGGHLFTRGPYGPLGQVLDRVGHPGAVEFRRTRDVFELYLGSRPGAPEIGRLRLPAQRWRLPAFALRAAAALRLSPADQYRTARLLARMVTMSPAQTERWNHRTMEEFVAAHVTNPRLVGILAFGLGLGFVLPPWQISAGEAIYCIQRAAHDYAVSYPVGGSSAIPLTYCRLARDKGADIRTRAQVRRILIDNGTARGVELRDGSVIDADIVVSTSSLNTTVLRLCDHAAFPHDYVERARHVVSSQTAVQVKIAVNRKLVQAGALIGFASESVDFLAADNDVISACVRQLYGGHVPNVMPFFCPVPTNFDPGLAPPEHQLLTACFPAPTTDITRRDPGPVWEEAALRTLRRAISGLDEHILFVDRTTVPWIQHWTGKSHGPAISTGQTPGQIGALRPAVTTPVRGLYLAGCGAGGRGIGTELAADSAMECAERILTDLGRPLPPTWHTNRHRAPTLTESITRAITPRRAPIQRD